MGILRLRPARLSVATVLLGSNVFTAWHKPRSTLPLLYGKHEFN